MSLEQDLPLRADGRTQPDAPHRNHGDAAPPEPEATPARYLAGAYTTGIVVGVAIVEWLHRSGVVTSTKHSVAPGIDLALGVIALIAAYVVWSGSLARRRERRERRHADRPKKPPRWQEALSGGTARTTFLIGLLLSFPGASYLAALTAIDKQSFGIAGDLLVVVAVNIVMLALPWPATCSRLGAGGAFGEKGSRLTTVVGCVVGRQAVAEIAEHLQIGVACDRRWTCERKRRADRQGQ